MYDGLIGVKFDELVKPDGFSTAVVLLSTAVTVEALNNPFVK